MDATVYEQQISRPVPIEQVTVGLTPREWFEIHREAYWLHHWGKEDHRVCLHAYTVAAILNRHWVRDPYICTHRRHTSSFTCYPDGRVMWGNQLIWATGGERVIEFVWKTTSEDDLRTIDYVEWHTWVTYCKAHEIKGLPVNRSGAPRFYRNGGEICPDWIAPELWSKYSYKE